jgi:cytochrome c
MNSAMVLAALLAAMPEPPPLPREALVAASYREGMVGFQTRCSACHALADGGADLFGPALHGVFSRRAGSKPGYAYSKTLAAADFTWSPARLAAWLARPDDYLPGSTMTIPEAVPEAELIPLIAYVMQETGAADWPRPAMPQVDAGSVRPDAPLSERYPSFWNHLMTNTTRYRLQGPAGELRFDAYFRTDGSVASSDDRIRGFWHVDEKDLFCYALYGLPTAPTQLVECFPVVAMSIARFREELWTSEPAPGVRLTGGILPGRPESGAPDEAAP